MKPDVYFSADVETDGPVPGPFSMLSMALVEAGRFDGEKFVPASEPAWFDSELRPISEKFDPQALAVNGIDRDRLLREGRDPVEVMTDASEWVQQRSAGGNPVLVAYPVSFDWTWLYWYFTVYSKTGSPFKHSRCFDIKTAYAVKGHRLISESGRHSLPEHLRSKLVHTHQALDDAREQAEIFAKIFQWRGK